MKGLPIHAAVNARLLALVSVLAVLLAGATLPAAAEAKRSHRIDGQERKIVRIVNSYRSQNGLKRLRGNGRLNRAANGHSWDMIVADYFSHTSRNGTSSSTRVRRYKRARAVGEVLAYLPRSQRRGAAWRVVKMWMNSPSHRAVLMSSKFRRIGVARQSGRLGSKRAIVYTADLTTRK